MADELFIKRHYEDVYVCQKCNAINRSGSGTPSKCRKCNGKRFRLKRKKQKTA